MLQPKALDIIAQQKTEQPKDLESFFLDQRLKNEVCLKSNKSIKFQAGNFMRTVISDIAHSYLPL